MKVQPKNKGSKQLFENPLLEKLAKTHYMVPITMFLVASAGMVFYNYYMGLTTIIEGILVFLLGLLFWTWFEYQMHKYVFHMEPTNKFKEKLQYMFHGVHHEYPRDKSRLAMPPLASGLIVAILFFGLRLIIGDLVFTALPGFLVGYTGYLWVHYSVHAFPPPKNHFKVLWINHSIHHYKDDTIAYGVSSPLWDYIYGTMPEKTYKRDKSQGKARA